MQLHRQCLQVRVWLLRTARHRGAEIHTPFLKKEVIAAVVACLGLGGVSSLGAASLDGSALFLFFPAVF